MSIFKFDKNDISIIGDVYVKKNGLVSHHINSYNDAIINGLPQIIEDVFKVDWTPNIKQGETNIIKANVKVKFSNFKVFKPIYKNNNSDKDIILTPIIALQQNKTYAGKMFIDILVEIIGHDKNNKEIDTKKFIKNDCEIGEFPIMVKSDLCHLSIASKTYSDSIEEDYLDYGGYFIIDGVEWVIETVESLTFNQPKIYNNIGHRKEITRCEFISKPGDGYQNSNQIIIKILNSNCITIQFNREGFRDVNFPFFVIFRLLGIYKDKDLFEKILFSVDPNSKKKMIHIIKLAFIAEYNILNNLKDIHISNKIIKEIGIQLNHISFHGNVNVEDPESLKSMKAKIDKLIDERFLEHIGLTNNFRIKKADFLAFLIRRTILVNFGKIMPTDRDSYLVKRLFTPGISLCKAFKTLFNKAIIQKISRRINEIKNKTFEQIDPSSIISNIESDDGFKKALFKSISTAKKSTMKIGQQKLTNRLTTQYLSRSNQVALYAMMRQLSAPNIGGKRGQSERTHELRRIHSTTCGYLCPITTPVSDKVGVNKQLTIYANIIKSSSSSFLIDILKNDSLIISDDKKLQKLLKDGKVFDYELSYIFVNGQIIGYCTDSMKIINKYKKMRRNKKFDSIYITIHWNDETDEIYFWCDRGRVVRPLIIVYNNENSPELFDKNNKKFQQKTLLTPKIIKGLKGGEFDIDYLVDNKIIEFISPSEQTNCLICIDIEKLYINKNDELNEYSHCDIPHSLIGLPGLTSPYGEHNQIARLIYQSNQVKQACGFPSLNWAYRTNKAFLQYNNENPLVMTKINNYIYPNGLNCLVAIMCNTGYNQEDSIIFSKGFIERGAFNGSKFEVYTTILGKNEEFGIPNKNQTDKINNKNYSKLNNLGIIDKGTLVNKGDVLIGKYVTKENSKDENYNKYEDKSIIYKSKEIGIVHNIIVDANNSDSNSIRKVVIRKMRPIMVGDKFSSRLGQKGVCGSVMDDVDMPFTEDGVIPGLIINPHCLTGDTLIKMSDGSLKYIKDIYNKNKEIKTVNPILLNTSNTRYEGGFKIMPKNKLLKIITYCGNTIKCTKDHKFLVRNKFNKRLWKKAENISLNEDKMIMHTECIFQLTEDLNFVSSSIKSIEEIDPEYVYDFTTNSKNHSFIANYFISHNCIPTRMTIGQLMESLTGINCALRCGHVDCTIFSNKDLQTIYADLKELGYNQFGYKRLYNGLTGEAIDSLIFMGPTYYQRLQKFISELIYSIVNAQTDMLTMQPLDGKSSGGGLRIGEMEKDILTAQGVARYISEKFYDHSDGYTEYICRCGNPAIVNIKINLFRCDFCKDNADICAVKTSWCSKLLIQELKSINVGIKRNIMPFIFENYEQ